MLFEALDAEEFSTDGLFQLRAGTGRPAQDGTKDRQYSLSTRQTRRDTWGRGLSRSKRACSALICFPLDPRCAARGCRAAPAGAQVLPYPAWLACGPSGRAGGAQVRCRLRVGERTNSIACDLHRWPRSGTARFEWRLRPPRHESQDRRSRTRSPAAGSEVDRF
jgi:hypothetical protein